jgi:hypothetical protein
LAKKKKKNMGDPNKPSQQFDDPSNMPNAW